MPINRIDNKWLKLILNSISIPILIISITLIPQQGISQYLIEGRIDSTSKYKSVHLDILDSWNFFNSVSDASIIKTKKINSDGTFVFSGTELPEKKGFYRIRYTEVEEGVSISFIDRNYVNFIFSNHDTIGINNITFISETSDNQLLADYIIQDIEFKKALSQTDKELNASMLEKKHKKSCLKEIENSDNGLTNLFKLHSSGISIEENQEVFEKVQYELKSTEIRPEYHHSISLLIHTHNYNYINKKTNWLIKVLAGSVFANILLLFLFINRKSKTEKPNPVGSRDLTNKERQVLQLIKNHKTNKEIALDLHVSEATIKTHINNIYRKLNVKSRKDAISSL